jgi:putative peptidoglycan lipid II flippase
VTVLRASLVMTAGTASSRVLGFVRALMLAWVLGVDAGPANAFALANTVPTTLHLLVAGGVLNAVIVPQVTRAARAADGGREFVDSVLTLSLTALLGVTVLLTVGAPLVVGLYAHGLSAGSFRLTVAFATWCLPQVLFYGLYTLLGQVLNARGSFGPYMWAPVLNNVVAIAGMAGFVLLFGVASGRSPADWTPTQIAVLAGTATLGVAAQALVLVVPLRRLGYRFRPRWRVRGLELAVTGRLAGWTAATLLVGQLGYLTVAGVASVAGARTEGTPLQAATPALTAYGLAILLFMLPHSLVAVSVSTALFTRMSRAAEEGDLSRLRHDVSAGLRILAVVSVAAMAVLVVLAGPAGRVMSAGPAAEGAAIGRVVAALALGLAAFSSAYLMQRACYALGDGRTPFLTQCVVTGVWSAGNLIALLVLPPQQIVVGVAVASSLAQALGAVALGVVLTRRLGGLEGRTVLATYLRVGLAGVAAGIAGSVVVAWLSGTAGSGRLGAAETCALGAPAIAAVYAAVLRLVGLPLPRLPVPGREPTAVQD